VQGQLAEMSNNPEVLRQTQDQSEGLLKKVAAELVDGVKEYREEYEPDADNLIAKFSEIAEVGYDAFVKHSMSDVSVKAGPGRCRSPRLRMPINSIVEGSNALDDMTWLAPSARPWVLNAIINALYDEMEEAQTTAAAAVGPARCFSPRHRSPSGSRNEGLHCVG